MAIVEEAIEAILAGAISAPVFPLKADADQALPFVTYRRVSAARFATIHNDIDDSDGRFQFDIFAETQSGALTVAEEISAAFDRYSGESADVTITCITKLVQADLTAGAEYASRIMQEYRISYETIDKSYIAYTSDPHFQWSGGIANFQTCVTWLNGQAQTKNIRALVVGGDLQESYDQEQSFKDFIRTGTYDTGAGELEGCNLNADIECLPVIGNWDTDSHTHDEIPEDPHSIIVGRYPEYFDGKEYYTWDYKDTVRIFVVNDITDYTTTAGANSYFQCNPPGAPLGPPANPDHSGITVAGSDQHSWLDSGFDTDHEWKILCCHRPFWSARDDRDGARRSNRVARPYLSSYIDRRLSLILSGDQHLGSLSGPWYPSGDEDAKLKDPGQLGAYELVAAGGFLSRQVIAGSLPDEDQSILWSSGGEDNVHNLSHMALLGFTPGSNVCDITIFEVTNETPTGSVVHTGELVQNVGA